MKKSNIITLAVLVEIIIIIALFIVITGQNSINPGPKPSDGNGSLGSENDSSDTSEDIKNTENVGTTENTQETEDTQNSETTEEPGSSDESDRPIHVTTSMDTALFIGDSRTVGIKEYSGLTGPDYFASVGMSLYSIHDERIEVPSVGTVSITELLSMKRYDKIYIMLGINEVGNNWDGTANRLKDLIGLINQKQPGSVVFIMANIHVSKSYQEKKPAFVTSNMNGLNSKLAALANNKDIFYLDANVLFDDAEGNLDSTKTGDGAHLKAVHYKTWVEWIIAQTKQCLGY